MAESYSNDEKQSGIVDKGNSVEQVLSPITHLPAELLKKISTDFIIKDYKENFDLTVDRFFKGLKEISVYKCQQTGYRFYHPFNIYGDDKFYEDLQKFDWYYLKWNWDYANAIKFIKPNSKVLDIGCGYGDFLEYAKSKMNCDCTGIEFNDKAIAVCREKGINISNALIEYFCKDHQNEYDVVCFYQVLEHITSIDSFLKSAIACLKPNGKLIICVPNNNPFFYQFDEFNTTNMPPHHMGMWNSEAFTNLQKYYPLKLDSIVEQRLFRYRYYTRFYIASVKNRFLRKILEIFKVFLTAYFVLIGKTIKVGHILSVYTKSN